MTPLEIAAGTPRRSMLGRRDARIVVLALAVALLAFLSEPAGELQPFAIYGFAVLVALGLSGWPLRGALVRLAVALPVLAGPALWLGAARALGGEPEFGVRLGASILLKGACAVVLVAAVVASARLGGLVEGLRRLGLPPALGLLLSLSARYVHLLADELARTSRARRARSVGRPRLASYASQLALLLARSWSRAHGVEHAMRARGFDEARALPPVPLPGFADAGLLAATLALFVLPRVLL